MKKEFKLGLIQAIGVTIYCGLVGFVMNNAEHVFGKMNNLIGPVTFLIMFTVSALICGLLVFYKPYKLFFANKKNEALNVVVYTAISLLTILFILFGAMYIF